jgi:hypothetical protein
MVFYFLFFKKSSPRSLKINFYLFFEYMVVRHDIKMFCHLPVLLAESRPKMGEKKKKKKRKGKNTFYPTNCTSLLILPSIF